MTKKGKKIADLGPGDWLGEIALITDSPRTATVTATSPVDVLVITDRRFRSVVETMPSIALKVLACVGERLSSDAHKLSGRRRRYAIAASPSSARTSAKKSASGLTRYSGPSASVRSPSEVSSAR